jgi:glycosyltransferase involved in cell wall biosynthesis
LAISNGYDPEDFRGLPPRKPATGPRVRFVHTGSFYRHYSPAPLRRALEHAAAARPELLRQMEVVFVGGCPVDFSGLPGLEARVLPRVSHAEAVAWLGRADALMNVYESKTGRHGVSGKLFEYLAAGRPILAVLPPDGTAAEIVRAARAGFTADPDRPDDVLDAVERCIAAAREPDFRPDPGVVRGYARPELAAALARVLDRVAG